MTKPWTSDITLLAAADDHAGAVAEHRRVITELIIGPYERGASLADLVAAHQVSVSVLLKVLAQNGVQLRAGAVAVLPPLLRRELARDVAEDSARLRSRVTAAELHGVTVRVIGRLIAEYRATLPRSDAAERPAPTGTDAALSGDSRPVRLTPVQAGVG